MGGDLNICGDVTQEEFNFYISFLGLYKAEISQIWNENTSIIHFSPFNYWWGGCESRSRATVEASPSGRKLYEIGKILPSLNPLMSRTTVMLVWKQPLRPSVVVVVVASTAAIAEKKVSSFGTPMTSMWYSIYTKLTWAAPARLRPLLYLSFEQPELMRWLSISHLQPYQTSVLYLVTMLSSYNVWIHSRQCCWPNFLTGQTFIYRKCTQLALRPRGA